MRSSRLLDNRASRSVEPHAPPPTLSRVVSIMRGATSLRTALAPLLLAAATVAACGGRTAGPEPLGQDGLGQTQRGLEQLPVASTAALQRWSPGCDEASVAPRTEVVLRRHPTDGELLVVISRADSTVDEPLCVDTERVVLRHVAQHELPAGSGGAPFRWTRGEVAADGSSAPKDDPVPPVDPSSGHDEACRERAADGAVPPSQNAPIEEYGDPSDDPVPPISPRSPPMLAIDGSELHPTNTQK